MTLFGFKLISASELSALTHTARAERVRRRQLEQQVERMQREISMLRCAPIAEVLAHA